MGDIVDEPVETVQVEAVVEDEDTEDRIATIELFEGGVVVDTKQCGASACKWETTRSPEPGQYYYFVKVTQADGNMLWSAPVWVNKGEVVTQEG